MIRDEHLKQIEAGAKPYSNESKAMATELLAWRSGAMNAESLNFNGYEFQMIQSIFGAKPLIKVTKPNGESFHIS